jgi:RNA polymerase sigma factor (TIGR02999 family)
MLSNFTDIAARARAGNSRDLDEFLPLVYDELKRIAARRLSLERANHTLQPTELVNEAYLRLVDQHSVDWQNRAHFFGMASEMMRRILVNYAESRNAKKRNEGKTLISLEEIHNFKADTPVDLILLNKALEELAELDRTQAKVVELKFFGGLTNEEAAEVLGVSPSTVKREWKMAKAWLASQLT